MTKVFIVTNTEASNKVGRCDEDNTGLDHSDTHDRFMIAHSKGHGLEYAGKRRRTQNLQRGSSRFFFSKPIILIRSVKPAV
jgi:hypothetical protein